jgi:FAD/FMN-containing dehydrogenase
MQGAPPELGGGMVFMTAPPAPFVPPSLRGQPAVAIVVAWFGDLERGQAALAPLRAFATPAADLVQPMPYLVLQSLLDAGNPPGRRHYWRSENLSALPDEAIDALVARAALASSPFTVMILVPAGGAVAAIGEDATPLGGRAAPWQYHCYGSWVAGDDAGHTDWVRATEQALRPWAAGRMSLNFVSEVSADRVRAAFGDEKYRRLVALKDRYDPTNLFRMNQNIPPTPR